MLILVILCIKMETNQKSETNSLKKIHFQGLHNRVQSKYEEMQRRLEKSKSIDSIHFASDETLVVGNNEKERRCSELEEIDKLIPDSGKQLEKHVSKESFKVEEVEVTRAQFEVIDTFFKEESNEGTISKIQTLSIENNEIDDNSDFMLLSPNNIANDTSLRTSNNSLNEIQKEFEEFSLLSPPTSKISIRSKIESRRNAAKERRRKKSLEKVTITKEKKKEAREKVEKLILSNTTKVDVIKYKKVKEATVTIALIEAKGLVEVENQENKTRQLYCRFRLGGEKQKSKAIKSIATKVEWSELINLSIYKNEESILEISLWDRDTPFGRKTVDISVVEREKTHKLNLKLEDMPGIELFILLTVTGTSLENTTFDFDDSFDTKKQVEIMRKEQAWYRLKYDYSDVGCLSVFVYGAIGLSGYDCHCVLQLDNNRLQTPTEHKTCDPNWMKMFTFVVKDVTSILEITIHDEKRSEDIGKLSIPLLKINNGERKWYTLKDDIQREKAKGYNPRVLIEMSLSWNLLKAALRVINPKEVKYLQHEEKLDRHIFSRNLTRAKVVISWVLDAFKVIKTCFEWEDARLNLMALAIWLLGCWFFKIWMIPLMFLIPFSWYRPLDYYLIDWRKFLVKLKILSESSLKMPEIEDSKVKEEKTSIRQKINSLHEMVQSVQAGIGQLADFGESIKNLFNFTVPYLSCIAIFIILLIALVMYFIPIQYILMAWSIRKFTRKKLQPNRVPNNEILDLLSRVPNDETLLDCKEIPVEETDEIIL